MGDESRKLRVVIVDDEAPARALLREYLAAHADVEVAGECANGFEAVKRIGELEPDLVFLDVQMPKLDGFEVLELLDQSPAVIFVTAYDEYALKAFEVHAIDYVLKPIGRDRLAEALAQARTRFRAAEPEPPPSPAALAAAARPPGQFVERILVKDGANVHVIPVERLDWIEAQDDYVGIAPTARPIPPQTLAEVATGLDPARFGVSIARTRSPSSGSRGWSVRQGQSGRVPEGCARSAGQPVGIRASERAAVVVGVARGRALEMTARFPYHFSTRSRRDRCAPPAPRSKGRRLG
jgi:two-component system LytT family response regulator